MLVDIGRAEAETPADKPLREKEAMSRMRVTHTMMATTTGTRSNTTDASIIDVLEGLWLTSARETPHHVNMALTVAARSQAPNRYHKFSVEPLGSSGTNKRATPAKSMLQNANARMAYHGMPMKDMLPRRSLRAT